MIVKNLRFVLDRRITPDSTAGDPPLGTYPTDDLYQGRLRPFISFNVSTRLYAFEVLNPVYTSTQIKNAISAYVSSGIALTTDIRNISPITVITSDVF